MSVPKYDSLLLFKNDLNQVNYDIINKNIRDKTFKLKRRRLSFNRMSKFEVPRILGLRVEQLTKGAQPTISISDRHTTKDGYKNNDKIALEELLLNTLPITVERYYLESGEYEIWHLNELIKDLHYIRVKEYKIELEKILGKKIPFNYGA